ncbi:folate-binding protein YgfZ [Hyphomicrobium sp. NDB2Meth4]|uniref:CAF17-like 4Fe-4S cluster assembly/insertion protein YgfZ n=1 Tax=Hyphomicrobium sp. NDB2Meth4 TaxID=1892846 RepID=UPI0009300004|nr:folate-binding protein YgfZ [Hyphomicrobium sp. NDB2Meth4]
MADTKIALLPDRGAVTIAGEDARTFLQGLVTNDMALIDKQPALYAGLLTPQGKILFDFFVVATPEGFCLEVARSKAGELVERLKMYKLRSKVEILDASADYTVAAIWGGEYAPHGNGKPPLLFADPRLPGMGYREMTTLRSDWALGGETCDSATQDEYHAHRIGLGVPEGGRDYAFGDAFPHEALFDQLQGVSFKKGCFVGQEVVARMQHRGLARRRVVPVVAASALPDPGVPITAGGVEIGKLGSTAGNRGLADIRIDRVAEFKAKGESVRAGDVEVNVELPAWATFSLEAKPAGSPA